MNNDWNIQQVWNKALEDGEQREYEPRDYLWASELGKPYVDNFLKMKAEKPTNPPNARSLRKFEAGNTFEWIITLILKRAGILKTTQERLEYQYPGLLRVSGKLDFFAGGKPNTEQAREELEKLELPESFYRGTSRVLDYIEQNFPDGLREKPLELKSLSANMFEVLERKEKPLKIHRLQAYHYIKSKNMERGDVIYISRDDMRILQMPVLLGSYVEEEYRGYIEKMTEFWKAEKQPPIEKPVIWDDDLGKFTKNNFIAWSPYLTKLYGLKDQKEFDDKYKGKAERLNRVLTRIADNKPMTANNEEALKEMREMGFDPSKLSPGK